MSDEKTQADPLLEFWHGQGTAVIHLSKLRPLLAQHGFHIVTEAEKMVLDAMAEMSTEDLQDIDNDDQMCCEVAAAELARRTP
jgi:hypothetical protein